MPFKIENIPATFQWLINGGGDVHTSIDETLTRTNLKILKAANLTVNTSKIMLRNDHIRQTLWLDGGRELKPITAKVEAINNFPMPST